MRSIEGEKSGSRLDSAERVGGDKRGGPLASIYAETGRPLAMAIETLH